jgi:hypothetical protein
MTTTASRLPARSALLPAAPAAIFTLLGLIDIALLGVIGSSIAPPLAVSLLVAALGLVTLAAVIPARHGSRPALRIAVAARVISALLAAGAFIATAPAWIRATEGFVIVATVAALVLLRRAARRPGA